MPRDLYTYKKYLQWFERRSAAACAHFRIRQAHRYAPFRRTGPAPQWHPDAYEQPGEVE